MHHDKIVEILIEYAEKNFHEALELPYGEREGGVECTNLSSLIVPQEGLSFSAKPKVQSLPVNPL